ncbi:MAG: cytochrome P460 family protein [Alphaproteobacteria bacterium]|uniref:Cytochrome P460 family protein n=1 Tax=Candidatus Nitrobium versatile TaxID=2884831 RepID=A0A953M1S1_9BACT|nr:cytochrome P460 family protein [Candidatus Nitrobium versatile]
MVKRILATVLAVLMTGLFLGGNAVAETDKGAVKYPEGYRDWTHVKSMVIQKGHPLYESFGGIHHIYANDKALKAMKAGKPFPDGSVLIFDLLEAKSENNALVEGPRKVLGVMQKNAKKFKETGGWGFEGFKGDTQERAVSDPKGACFNCHEGQKGSDYVFSKYRK